MLGYLVRVNCHALFSLSEQSLSLCCIRRCDVMLLWITSFQHCTQCRSTRFVSDVHTCCFWNYKLWLHPNPCLNCQLYSWDVSSPSMRIYGLTRGIDRFVITHKKHKVWENYLFHIIAMHEMITSYSSLLRFHEILIFIRTAMLASPPFPPFLLDCHYTSLAVPYIKFILFLI